MRNPQPYWGAAAKEDRVKAGFKTIWHQQRLLLIASVLLGLQPLQAGTWTALSHTAPEGIGTVLLLSDGTVMAQGGWGGASANWYRLTPANGSYANGTWSTLASMHDSRLYYSSQVLKDGRVFVAGGEYGSATNVTTAEVYDPQSNTWTLTPASGQSFLDSTSEILPDGTVLIAPVIPSVYGGTVIYDPVSNTWLAGPNLYRGYDQDEASWVKLSDNSILAIDPFGTNTERYISSLNAWVDDAKVPVSLYDSYGFELGAGILLASGQAFYLGSTGHTAIYTPSGTASPGSWVAGPDIPNGQGTPDAPAAMMVDGKILCAVSPAPTAADHYPTPVSFYEYDPVSNAFTRVNGPTGLTYPGSAFYGRMLDLPDGSVLFSAYSSQLYLYQPSGFPLPEGKPTIVSLNSNGDGSYHLTGTLFNGISEGAAYGDDAQMNSNYPIVRMVDANGNVYYARTFNWSSTGVMTGNTLVSTELTLPNGLASGAYALSVIANGNSSEPITFLTADALGIGLLPSSQILLSWPTNTPGVLLETTTDLVAGVWSPVTDTVVVVGSSFVVTNSASATARFFRLHSH
ncbi:MAG TPA: kelch repeat-containing protein [Verrucomicrobiae bacterium]|nr:kelch repeat-containing protein [Verrucomicrobiae bacterium]